MELCGLFLLEAGELTGARWWVRLLAGMFLLLVDLAFPAAIIIAVFDWQLLQVAAGVTAVHFLIHPVTRSRRW